MIITEFYVIRDGMLIHLPKGDLALVALLKNRSKRQKRFGTLEALEILIYPQDIKITPRSLKQATKYGEALIKRKGGTGKARKDTEAVPLLDLPSADGDA